MKRLDILYEDNSVIIINKPAGLAVQGGKGVKISVDRLLAEARRQNGESPPLLVHRLDKDTSGALLTAKTKEEAARFSSFFNERKTAKYYIAVCADLRNSNNPKQKEGIITLDLEIRNKTKKSITKYKEIKNGEISNIKYSVLNIKLETGRMHQIRRHLAMAGIPILGDDKYGDFKLNKQLKQKKLMLHSYRLIIKEAGIDVTAPLPKRFLEYIQSNIDTTL